MQTRKMGQLTVSAIGLGCMGMAGTAGMAAMYGPVDRAEAIATLHRALDLGINFLDTAEVYGPFANEELLGEALAGRRDEAVIATKFGFRIVEDPAGNSGATRSFRTRGVDSSPGNIRAVCEASLKRLRTDRIDLFYQHRVDPSVPIEEVIGTLADLKREGKILGIGLSEAGADTIRRAHATHPIDALQSEWSLWERTIETDILPVVRELGIGLVPYSPLGRGFLAGLARRAEELPEGDYRRTDPRYQGANFDANMKAVDAVKAVAARHGATPAQIALAWLLAQGPDVAPIPGSKRRATLEDNAGAVTLALDSADLAALEAAAPVGATAGERYGNPAMLKMVRI
jgi:aryl-alcohol dehydrogenase-like predicted oxidoreductase